MQHISIGGLKLRRVHAYFVKFRLFAVFLQDLKSFKLTLAQETFRYVDIAEVCIFESIRIEGGERRCASLRRGLLNARCF